MELFLLNTASLAGGFLLDLLIGDPEGWPHLIRGFGALVSLLEKGLYPLKNKRLGGGLLVVSTLLCCTALPGGLLLLCYKLSPWAYLGAGILLCWQLLALKSLRVESKKVYTALEREDLPGARQTLSRIVGRDTGALNEQGVIRAAVETVAENASDGVAAPLFYIALGGPVLGCLYKAANTMDSMIGYKNARYLSFGRCAARLDDALNFLPSRLCALLLILSAFLCGLDGKSAFRIWRRDRRNHESPNAAQTESVVAGALGVGLGGDAVYFGELHKKPALGDGLRPVDRADILTAHRLIYVSSLLALVLALLLRGCVYVSF